MSSKALPLKRLFIRRMITSAIIQFVILGLIFILVKNYITHAERNNMINNLTISDSFSQEELSRYKVLANDYAFNLALHNIADDNKLDAIWFTKTFNSQEQGFGKCFYVEHTNYLLCDNKKGTYYGITPLKVSGNVIGYVIASKKYSFVTTSTYYGLSIILLMVVGVFLFNFIILFLSMKRRIEGNTIKLLDFISGQSDQLKKELDIQEYSLVAQKFLDKKNEITRLEKEKSYNEAMQHLAEQVAHDIKSPLAAINAAIANDKEGHASESRNVIKSAAKRLNDIASNLFIVGKNKANESKDSGLENEAIEAEPLFFLIDGLISEKQYEYSGSHIKINFYAPKETRTIFSKVNGVELKRVLSNIINNAVEATHHEGEVLIDLRTTDDEIIISIADNGIGIPPNLLSKVTEEGFSFGKEGGEGLGLFHAKTQIEKFNGTVQIESAEGKGTTVSIRLKRCHTPPWFVEKLFVQEASKVVILDDDRSIHDLWYMKFIEFKQLDVHSFYTAEDAIKNQSILKTADICLIDYELSGSKNTGLDIINLLKNSRQSILVTSDFESLKTRSLCKDVRVKILPKPYLRYIKISSCDIESIILIDDDELTREAWLLSASEANKYLSVFSSPEDFSENRERFDANTTIYIDSDLSAGVRGEEYAKKLFDEGFKKIYLATGYPGNKFIHMDWIVGVVGKEPPFDVES